METKPNLAKHAVNNVLSKINNEPRCVIRGSGNLPYKHTEDTSANAAEKLSKRF